MTKYIKECKQHDPRKLISVREAKRKGYPNLEQFDENDAFCTTCRFVYRDKEREPAFQKP